MIAHLLALLLVLPALAAAQTADENAFRQKLFQVLREEFARQTPTYSRDVLARLKGETGLEEKPLRARLLALLDSLEEERSRKTETWKKLLDQGGSAIPPAAADKLVRRLADEGRAFLQGEDNYLLDNGVRQATRRARLRDFQGRAFLLQALDWGLTRGQENGPGEEVGVLVGGHSNRFEVARDPLYIFFDTSDEAFVLEQVREVQRFIIPALTRRLPASPHIKWAVRQRESNALVQPAYRLVFGVDNLSFTGSNLDLRPCIEATVDIYRGAGEELLSSEKLNHCTREHGSASTHRLDPFYQEVADETRKLLDAFLQGR